MVHHIYNHSIHACNIYILTIWSDFMAEPELQVACGRSGNNTQAMVDLIYR